MGCGWRGVERWGVLSVRAAMRGMGQSPVGRARTDDAPTAEGAAPYQDPLGRGRTWMLRSSFPRMASATPAIAASSMPLPAREREVRPIASARMSASILDSWGPGEMPSAARACLGGRVGAVSRCTQVGRWVGGWVGWGPGEMPSAARAWRAGGWVWGDGTAGGGGEWGGVGRLGGASKRGASRGVTRSARMPRGASGAPCRDLALRRQPRSTRPFKPGRARTAIAGRPSAPSRAAAAVAPPPPRRSACARRVLK